MAEYKSRIILVENLCNIQQPDVIVSKVVSHFSNGNSNIGYVYSSVQNDGKIILIQFL